MNDKQIIKSQIKLLYSRQLFDIEITTRCNKACYICPRNKLRRSQQDMNIDLFLYLLDWLPANSDVFFSGFGEPLLHPKCSYFIKQLSKKSIRTSIITNGKLLSKTMIKELFDSGLYKLQISVLLKNEYNLIDYYINLFNPKEYQKVQFNLLTEDFTDKFAEKNKNLRKLGFKSELKHIHSRGGSYFTPMKVAKGGCGTFFKVIYINNIGNIHICSNDINAETVLGNISKIFFSDLINRKKEYIGKAQISDICKYCTDEYRYKNLEI